MQRYACKVYTRYAGAYILELPLGRYPLRTPPDRRHQHNTFKRKRKSAVRPKPKFGLAPTARKSIYINICAASTLKRAHPRAALLRLTRPPRGVHVGRDSANSRKTTALKERRSYSALGPYSHSALGPLTAKERWACSQVRRWESGQPPQRHLRTML